jgi:outer membrane protein assembly factor BamB
MSRRLAAVWAFTLLTLAGPLVRAQNPFPRDLIPTRTALARLGLERQWFGVVPLKQSERVAKISRSSDLLFALTDQGGLHTFDAETGKLLWSADLGGVTPYAHGVSSNSYMVFGTSGEQLSALDRKTGRLMWRKSIDALPPVAPWRTRTA